MLTKQTLLIGVILTTAIVTVGISSTTKAHASVTEDEETSCYITGNIDGQNGPYDPEDCNDDYYNGFIDGCMKEGNTREVCEGATDG